jgi:hypothetical protein
MNVFRLSKIGVNALTATNPNDFIFGSDWNTPKIIKEAATQPTISSTGSEAYHDLAHGLNYTPALFGFVKFDDGRVGLIGTKQAGVEFYSTNLRVNATNVRFGYYNDSGSNKTPTFRYIATEIPLAGTPNVANASGKRIIISKSGVNALTSTNPNDRIYDSQFGTLKYFNQGISQITIGSATPAAGVTAVYETVLATHNLGYYPFFTGNQEYSVDDPGTAYIMPLMFASAGFWMYDMLYVTTTQLIFRREFGSAFGAITYPAQTIKVYWKIYSKNLGF